MADHFGLLFQVGIVLFLLLLGYGVGHHREKKHIRLIEERLRQLSGIGVTNRRKLQPGLHSECRGLVTGCAVIATDYFKVFASAMRNLFGGEMRAFESLVFRARQEALIRMLTEAQELGANAVINVRFETSTISGQQKKQAGGIEVLVYGTALRVVAPAGV